MSFVPDTQNKEFQDALNLIQYTRQSVFLTGKAGTGKSTFLKYICANTKKKHVVLAPTGIAAINAGGSTLHSFFKLPFYPLLPDDPNFSLQRGRIHEFFKYTKPHRKLLEELELVIIDEISMVRADIIDAVDRILRVYSRNLREPFGGKQILLVGDVFQLEPVVKGDEREILNRFYPTPYFFSARVFGQIDLVSIELQKVYRQTDSKFIHVLDHIRNNTVGSTELQLLNTRYGTQIEQSEADMYITLATRRDNVDYINDKKLAELPGDPVTFYGEIMGDFPESSLPTSQELVLKPGAQITLIICLSFQRRSARRYCGRSIMQTLLPCARRVRRLHRAYQTILSKNICNIKTFWIPMHISPVFFSFPRVPSLQLLPDGRKERRGKRLIRKGGDPLPHGRGGAQPNCLARLPRRRAEPVVRLQMEIPRGAVHGLVARIERRFGLGHGLEALRHGGRRPQRVQPGKINLHRSSVPSETGHTAR